MKRILQVCVVVLVALCSMGQDIRSNQVKPGTFQNGNYSFPGNLAVSGTFQAPGLVAPSKRGYTYPGGFAGVSEVVNCSSNPVLTYGASGAFDAGELRDPVVLRTYGTQPHEYYMLYAAAKLTTSPWYPTVGLAHSDDGCTWTKDGQVIAPQGSGAWNSGTAFSPGVFYDYDPATKTGSKRLYIYVSTSVLPTQWYTGPMYIGLVTVDPGLDWTSSANYIWQGTGPIIDNSTGCTGTQGVYAPQVLKINGTPTMFYSVSNSGYPWNVCAATSSSLTFSSPTYYAGNPITSTGIAEEPAVAKLENGGLVMFTDTINTNYGFGFSTYTTTSANGLAPWTWSGFVPVSGTWVDYHIGSQSVVEMPDGRWLVVWGGAGTTMQIGASIVSMNTQTANPQAVVGWGKKWGSTFTVSAPGLDSSIGVGTDATHNGSFYWDFVNNRLVISTAGFNWPVQITGSNIGVSPGDNIFRVSPSLIGGTAGAGGVALGDAQGTQYVGIYRSGTDGTGVGNTLNLDAYDQINFHVGTGGFQANPRLMMLDANGLHVGPSDTPSLGSISLGDQPTAALNVGIYRGTSAGGVGFGNWLNLDGYDGLNLNVGNAAFGSKTNVGSCTTAGCTFKVAITSSNGVTKTCTAYPTVVGGIVTGC